MPSPYIGMVAILFNGAEPFKQIVKILLTEGHVFNMVKISQRFQRRPFKKYTFLYMYIGQGQGQIKARGQHFGCN